MERGRLASQLDAATWCHPTENPWMESGETIASSPLQYNTVSPDSLQKKNLPSLFMRMERNETPMAMHRVWLVIERRKRKE